MTLVAESTTHVFTRTWYSDETHSNEDGTTYTVQVQHQEQVVEIEITFEEIPDPPTEEQVQAAAEALAEQGLEPSEIEREIERQIEAGELRARPPYTEPPWPSGFSGGGAIELPHTGIISETVAGTPPPDAELEGTTPVTASALDHFDDWDANSDGVLSERELEDAIADAANTGEDAAALVALYRAYDTVKGASDDQRFFETGITENDLIVVEAENDSGNDFGSLNSFYNAAKTRLDGSAASAFVGDIDPFAVKQGGYPSCAIVASIVGLADARPEVIHDMITENDDGTFTVDFPGGDSVTVGPLTDGQLAIGASAGANGQWAAIIELAYNELENYPNGDSSADTIELLTGNDVIAERLGSGNQDDLLTQLEETLDAGGVVVVGNDWRLIGEDPLPDWHFYTVLGYDAEAGTITVRNPWGRTEPTGTNDGADDGVFTMTVDEFWEVFDSLAFEDVP